MLCYYTAAHKRVAINNRHIASVHEGNKSFKCKICGYSCSQKSHINQNVVSVHEKNKALKCNICSSLKTQTSMNQHIATVHERIKPFKCCRSERE